MITFMDILRYTIRRASFQMLLGLTLMACAGLGWQALRPGAHPCAELPASMQLICDPAALDKVGKDLTAGLEATRDSMTKEGLARRVEDLKALANTVTYDASKAARPWVTIETTRRSPIVASTERANNATLAWLDQGASLRAEIKDALWLKVEHQGVSGFVPRSFVRITAMDGYQRCRTTWDSSASSSRFECQDAAGLWVTVKLD